MRVLAARLSLSLMVVAGVLGCPSKPIDDTKVDAPADLAGLVEHRVANPNATAAYRWVDIMLEVTGREVDKVGARPTIISRQMAIPMTAMYDAWAAYDAKAVGTRLGGSLRRPEAERTLANKETAIAYAVYTALVDLFPADKAWLDEQMRAQGHDPALVASDPADPKTGAAAVGQIAARAVLDYRRKDGANQAGDLAGATPYADTTGYAPKNPGDEIVDPDRWQPIPFDDGKGGTFRPGFLTPHWGKVTPFALERGDQFRPPPPPLVGSPELEQQTDECIQFNGSLSLEQKAIVEFMRDGPRSTGQSGHWLQFAQDVSRRDRHDLDADVKLFFAVANTAFDAFIAAWDGKRHYDSSRPWTLVRHYHANDTITGYLGPCKGTGPIQGKDWWPYSPRTFPTPPFPGYPSGHSTVSAASSRMLALFTGSDEFGAFARHEAGIYTEAECTTAQMQASAGKPADVPDDRAIILRLPTFTAVAEMAGISRVMGGYHIQADNTEGLALGKKVAEYAWPKYQAYFDGTAPAPAAGAP